MHLFQSRAELALVLSMQETFLKHKSFWKDKETPIFPYHVPYSSFLLVGEVASRFLSNHGKIWFTGSISHVKLRTFFCHLSLACWLCSTGGDTSGKWSVKNKQTSYQQRHAHSYRHFVRPLQTNPNSSQEKSHPSTSQPNYLHSSQSKVPMRIFTLLAKKFQSTI